VEKIVAKPSQKEITAADLTDYLNSESDFAFEIRAIKELQKAGDVLHGGTYMDAITGKPRQFDIRVTISKDRCMIRLAVECKNLKTTFPLLVSCLPRSDDEAFQHIAVSIDLNYHTFLEADQGETAFLANEPFVQTFSMASANCMYKTGEPVGKTLAQVIRDSNNLPKGDDKEIYNKWSQALSSADDLVAMCPDDGKLKECDYCFSSVIPVLVVPDGTLWRCAFDLDGNRTIEPELTKRVQLFVGKQASYQEMMFLGPDYMISHLEIVTLSGLPDLIADLNTHETLVPASVAKSFEENLGPCFDDRYH
jgi:hypothetical protein